MGILNSRRFVTLQTNAPSVEEAEKAEILTDIREIVNANKNIPKYVFERNKELENVLDTEYIAVHWFVKMSNNGKAIQRAELVDKDGNTNNCRLYGTEKELLKEDTQPLKNFACGFCKSGGEIVTELQQRNGKLMRVPVQYVNVAEKRS